QALADAIDDAKKVALFVGHGIGDAHDAVVQLAEKIKAPIGHSLRGKDLIQYDNPYDVGMTGLLGYAAAAAGLEDADLVVLLGTDFPYDQFLPDERSAQAVVDDAVIWRPAAVDVAVQGEVGRTLAALQPLLKEKKVRRSLDKMLDKRDRLM